MESIEGEGDSTGALEDSWWSEKFPQSSNYHSLPETSKWVCRLERASTDGPICLKVSTAGQSHFYLAFYTSIFMLLNLHHLSLLAEVIRLPAGAPEVPHHMKNIHFLDQMRLKILSGACDLGDPKDDPFVKQWVLRLIHGIPNSKMLREREPAIAAQKAPLTISPKKHPQNVKGNQLAADVISTLKMRASNAIRKYGTNLARKRLNLPAESGPSNDLDEGHGTASQKKRKTSEIIQPPPNGPQLMKGKKPLQIVRPATVDLNLAAQDGLRIHPQASNYHRELLHQIKTFSGISDMPGLISAIKLVSFDKGLFHKIIIEDGHCSDAYAK
ncbi:hypothetical protein BYT27DRAFT_7261691 [Phlegmacium glaucopus]|nr:hypothetical protein BYT27DRAFT_7261691 [Phlegmacium glaucopus]